MNIDFKERTVLVTGGTRGIGAAIVEEFVKSGANLIVTGASNYNNIEKLNNECIQRGLKNVKYVLADFTDKISFKNFFNYLDSIPQIDVCINNAGTNRNNFIEDILEEDFELLINLNLKAPFEITKYLAGRFKKQKYGRIVNISSIWGVKSREKRTAYTLTKSGLIGLTKTSSIELAPYNVLVNAVSPGFTQTELTMSTVPESEIKLFSEAIPLKRFAQPVEIARLVLFLASDMNTYITGQNIIIDGGFINV